MATRISGKPNEYAIWIKKVLAAHPTAQSDGGRCYFIETKIVAEWNGSQKKEQCAPCRDSIGIKPYASAQ